MRNIYVELNSAKNEFTLTVYISNPFISTHCCPSG